MQTHEIIEEALKLKAIDRVWGEEAVRRVRALDEGRMKTYALDEVLAQASGTP